MHCHSSVHAECELIRSSISKVHLVVRQALQVEYLMVAAAAVVVLRRRQLLHPDVLFVVVDEEDPGIRMVMASSSIDRWIRRLKSWEARHQWQQDSQCFLCH